MNHWKILFGNIEKVFPLVVCQSLENSYYHLNDTIQNILDDEEYKSKISDPGRVGGAKE